MTVKQAFTMSLMIDSLLFPTMFLPVKCDLSNNVQCSSAAIAVDLFLIYIVRPLYRASGLFHYIHLWLLSEYTGSCNNEGNMVHVR